MVQTTAQTIMGSPRFIACTPFGIMKRSGVTAGILPIGGTGSDLGL